MNWLEEASWFVIDGVTTILSLIDEAFVEGESCKSGALEKKTSVYYKPTLLSDWMLRLAPDLARSIFHFERR